ncbi:MAG: tRNA pseudouridine(54/55) synthase Pus10 [Archaeoglobi archaeon]|nr:tRNA pseudouridine(54/55) synthase Pus10 [Candidatus Mnemosynella bozhongmuii]
MLDEEILQRAERIVREGYICNRCLGRQFSAKIEAENNEERGRILKEELEKRGISSEETGICWVCTNLFEEVDEWAERVIEKLSEIEFSTFLIGSRLPPEILESEELLWEKYGADYAESIKLEFNREIGKRVARRLKKRADFSKPDVVAIVDVPQNTVELQIRSLYISGRYRKLVRGIPQTHWPCSKCRGRGCEHCGFTGKQYPESVEELIGEPLLRMTEGERAVLHGAGREDIDARMLGTGRPFIIEIKRPRKRFLDLKTVEREINEYARGKVEVEGLQEVSSEFVEMIKEMRFEKTYRVRVKFEREISREELERAVEKLSGITVKQRTPKRVSHRRADKIRERKIYKVSLISFDTTEAVLEITCDSGLYVKELVSGDDGRTVPSLSSLLSVQARVIELDVIDAGGLKWQDIMESKGK